MTDHLPECPYPYSLCQNGCEATCICQRLADCERRVMNETAEVLVNHALDSARDAVAALPSLRGTFWQYDALAAIDALRGER